ncbi:MAG: GntR family transcriptional regulator [Chloroflexi bacterium]|nr:GntR family transcriptional regulator [Chloroflexota bacterium]
MKITRDSAFPLYQQLASALRHQIETGKLKPGAMLPPESILTRQFQVSRITARQALDLLVAEGLIIRKQGKGTFVCPPKIQQDLSSLRGFAELMATRGAEQKMQVLAFEMVLPDQRVAESLRVTSGEQVLRIKRRHLLKGNPIAYAIIYLPRELGQRFTINQVSQTPIYSLLTEKARVEIKRATQVVRAIGADQDAATVLKLPRGAPVMMVERITYARDEKPVEYILFFHRGDSYELTAELNREPTKNILRQQDNLGRFAPDS